MTSLVEDAARAVFEGREKWPEKVNLYQPDENTQILLPEAANCLGVKAYLRMCNLRYQEMVRQNAEFMSKTGKVPCVVVGKTVHSDIRSLVTESNTKGISLSSEMSAEKQAEMKAYMSLLDNTLINAELYLSWVEKTTLIEVSRPRYGSPYPWPLNVILPLKKQYEIHQLLEAVGWAKKSYDDVKEDVNTCCQALSEKLGDQIYFFGDKPTEMDAAAFGHLYTLMNTMLPTDDITKIVRSFGNLAEFCTRVHRVFFQEFDQEQ